MKPIHTIFYSLILLFLISSCTSEDGPKYEGKNELFLAVEETNVLEDSENETLIINLMLTRVLDKDVDLKFFLKNNEHNSIQLTSFSQNPIRIKAGEKTAQIILNSNNKGTLTNERVIELSLENSTNPDVTLNKPLLITLKPGVGSVSLTEDQLKLIEGYKNNGIDISKWIGLIPVKVKIIYPGGGSFSPFLDKYEKTIEGKTAITLSPNSTPDKIVLKMEHNAMGIENYLYDILRAETILETEFWLKQPSPQRVVDLVGLKADRAEAFNLALDNLVLDKVNSTVSFVNDNTIMDIFGTTISAINFQYIYSAWDRLKKLIDEGNQDAIDANEQGGTIYPGYILNHTGIKENGWGGEAWIKPTSSFNLSTGEMKFMFNLDHINAGDYIRFEVSYSPVK